MSFPTAEEARKQSARHIAEGSTIELASLQSKIQAAIQKGQMYIGDDGTLSADAAKRLHELGYVVTFGQQYNDPYYSISWKQHTA